MVISISPLTLRYKTKSPSLKNTLNCDSSFKPRLAPLISNSPNVSNKSPESTISKTSIKNSTSNSSTSNSLKSSNSSSANSSSSNSVKSKKSISNIPWSSSCSSCNSSYILCFTSSGGFTINILSINAGVIPLITVSDVGGLS